MTKKKSQYPNPNIQKDIGRVVVLGLFLLLLVGVSCFRLDSFLFEATTLTGEYFQPADIDTAWHVRYIIPDSLVEPVQLTSSGKKIYGFFVRPDGQHPVENLVTVLYNHGNADNINRYWGRVELLWEMGYQVFIYDYQGYGRSEGTPSGAACYSDARTALDYCLGRADVDTTKIVYYGWSLGSFMATYLAADIRTPLVEILETPIASTSGVAREGAVLDIPGSMLADADFDNEKRIGRINCPLLMLAGKQDETAEFERNALRLYEECNQSRTEYHWLDDANHISVPETMGAEYAQVITEFIARNLP